MERTPCLTILDSFSRHGFFLRTKTAIEIANQLTQYFSNHGISEKITFDNGIEFKNNIIQELAETHQISLHYITNYNPTSNAFIERFHSTLIEQIIVIEDKNISLGEKLNRALLSYSFIDFIYTITNY